MLGTTHRKRVASRTTSAACEKRGRVRFGAKGTCACFVDNEVVAIDAVRGAADTRRTFSDWQNRQMISRSMITRTAFETRMRDEFARYAQVIKTIEIKGER